MSGSFPDAFSRLPDCIVLAGGGTGGHLMPGLAVANELRQRGVRRLIFVGAQRGLEARLVPPAGFELELLDIGGLRNLGWRRQWQSLASLPTAILRCRRLLLASRAAAVLGIGGYASGPMLVAARWCGTPLVLLEINTRPGLANRLAGGWARAVAVAFAESAPFFSRSVLTGLPVRAEFLAPAPDSANSPAALSGAALRLLCFGGGQGARALNLAMLGLAAAWGAAAEEREIIHQTGAQEWDRMRDAYQQLPGECLPAGPGEKDGLFYRHGGLQLRALPFIADMASAMRRARMVVCRSGAGTLAELAAMGRPAVLVPYPASADNHQLHNARAFVTAGAALLLEQDRLSPQNLEKLLFELQADPQRLAAMSSAARALARPRATAAIADLVLRFARSPAGN